MMQHIFLIADTHFGEDAIRRYENRPFDTAAAMDAAMIGRWNQTVTAADTVYVLGDFSASGREREILSQLNGKKLLVKGNHDTRPNAYYRDAGFCEVYDYPILYQGFWILSHEPVYVNENMPYANVFGHVHRSPIYQDYSSQHYCVSVERIGYQPISFEAVRQAIQNPSGNPEKGDA